jgi:hypothetical protein
MKLKLFLVKVSNVSLGMPRAADGVLSGSKRPCVSEYAIGVANLHSEFAVRFSDFPRFPERISLHHHCRLTSIFRDNYMNNRS